MADANIKKDFIDGINEVYATMFTDGVNDGVYFYPLYEPKEKSIYGEVKYKKYLQPVLLVAKVQITPKQGEEDVKGIKGEAVFTVPVKSLMENKIDVSNKNLVNLRKGIIQYKDTFYEVDNVEPKTFVADTFMTYAFKCTEEVDADSVHIFIPPSEEGDENVRLQTTDDGGLE